MISVIIPSHNHARYLSYAIDSVLQQTYSPVQVVVVNDGSVDDTADVVKPYLSKIDYIYQANAGAGAARNWGVQHAKGDYLAFLDADDLWSANKLQCQMRALNADASLDMVFGFVKHFYCSSLSEETKARLCCPSDAAAGVTAATMLIKKESFYKVGFFNPMWQAGEFIDWYVRAQAKQLKHVMLSDIFLSRRVHAGHLNKHAAQSYQSYLKILRSKITQL